MRTLKRMGSALLSTLLLLSLTLFAWADQQEPYTYRVTFRAGAQGTMVGDQVEVRGKGYHIERSQDAITVTGLHLGDRVTWDNDAVAPTEDHRYYVRGVKDSWLEENTESNWGSAVITKPVSVNEIHAWRKANPEAFIAALAE